MGSEDELPRKFKLPRKMFGDINTLHPPSVPRKLRSAIKKRSCESACGPLLDPKILKPSVNGLEPLRKDCLKKSKMSMLIGCSDHSPKQDVSLPISKDEEEVVETLFALAGMIPLNDIPIRNTEDGESSEAKTLELAKKHEELMPPSEGSVVPNEEQEVTNAPAIVDPVLEKPLIEPASLGWPKLSERRQLNLDLKVSVPPVKLQAIPPLLMTCDQGSLINSTLSYTSTEPSWENGYGCRINTTNLEKSELRNDKSMNKFGAVDIVATKERQHATSTERIDNGMASRALTGSGVDGHPLQSSAINFPSWLSTATSSSRLVRCEDNVLNGKASCSRNGSWKTRKRCATHVYISRLIQVLQTSPQGEDIQRVDASQSQCQSGRLATSDHSNDARNEILNGTLTATHLFGPHHERVEGPRFSGCSDSRKQSFEFLSLSAGVGLAADNGVNGLGKSIDSDAKCQTLFLHSVAQQSTMIPFSMPPHRFPSNPSYGNQVVPVSVAPPTAPSQVSTYFANPFGVAHMSNKTTEAQQQAQSKQQQQQQQIWTAQLAAAAASQLRPGVVASRLSNWQNNRMRIPDHNLRSSSMQLHPQMQALSQLQQPPPQVLIGLGPSFPQPKVKSQQQPQLIPLICEDNGGRFRPDGILPLQLLCNERR